MYFNLLIFRRKLNSLLFFNLALMKKIIEVLARNVKNYKLLLLYQRKEVIKVLKDHHELTEKKPRILVVIAHIASEEQAREKEKAAEKIEKIKNTIDGLLASFAHCELTIFVSTTTGRHITQYLPEYQIQRIQVQEEENCDPMYIGFKAQDKFADKQNDFDWFLFIEDDIVIQDSLFLEKLEKFNQNCGNDRAVLLPNRYEIWEGNKSYIDLTIEHKLAWDKFSAVEVEGIKLAECSNPHSGIYCLSQSQLKIWLKTGRKWQYQSVFVGPLESAATFCLLECFSLYKPHPKNLHFLEVRHYDTKYSKLYPDPSPYILSPVKTAS